MAKRLGVNKRDKDKPNTEALPNPWAPPKSNNRPMDRHRMFLEQDLMSGMPGLGGFGNLFQQPPAFQPSSSQSLPQMPFLNTMSNFSHPQNGQPFNMFGQQAFNQPSLPPLQTITHQQPVQVPSDAQERYSSQLEQLRAMGFTVIIIDRMKNKT